MRKRVVLGAPRTRMPAALGLAIALLAPTAFAGEQEFPSNAAVPKTPGGRDEIKNDVPILSIWKRITVGTRKGVNDIRNAFDSARIRVGDSADEILGRPGFSFSKTEAQVNVVLFTAAELEFQEGYIPLAEIYRRAAEFGLELCPAELGPQLRLQYLDQPVGEALHLAMHPIPTYRGDLVDLTVANGGAGLLLLGGDGSPGFKAHTSIKFVFVRPSQVAGHTARPFRPGIGTPHDSTGGLAPQRRE
jgi:hypothetical protein